MSGKLVQNIFTKVPKRRTRTVAPAAYKKGTETPNFHATLED
jgi:hypothetical protein